MLSETLIKHIEALLRQAITNIQSVGGGSINRVYCLFTATNKFLLKVNSQRFPKMFHLERQGLEAIAATKTVAVPDVIANDDLCTESFLLMEWIAPGDITKPASELLGEQLAAMHLHTAESFGLDHDNYMGSLPQSNCRHDRWSDFFIIERLQPMLRMAVDSGLLDRRDVHDFEILFAKLPGLFTEEAPALIHGDLWSGNYLIGINGKPYLIDPAVSYGHREFDIAMSTLFGGFDNAFYNSYQKAYPLQPGWQQRIGLWNLYPLLVHVNLFGGGYVAQLRKCLKQYQ